ncbi:NAD(P)-binding protein [Rhizopogon vinicolor AM-OR11-026]|uniref:Very-long-chain 3-oxoacyl-CoA reductase n=1 Tax=Rhizopogon vinicolor AM-OR11-026 TaxID=1314800 RepID=A0A1B7MID9_9AGAM|nr:NAD(P)-binding protein [Rhizopogon vinicolor AM-OR11-026]
MDAALKIWLLDQVNNCPWPCTLLLFLGALTFARFTFKTLVVFLQTFILPGTSLKKFGAKKGAWAVVTGASDGIGREFAIQLGSSGFNILLVARNSKMLNDVAAEIAAKTKSAVETRIYLIDFAQDDKSKYEGLKVLLQHLDVGVLVNNVGKSHTMPTYFAETEEQENADIVAINVNATIRVTHAVLPGMIQRKRGLILNLGSFAGLVPSPMLATYSGTKAFLATFTSALAEEVRSQGIVVQHLNTYFVVSKMSNIRRTSALVPTPASYVHACLSKIGFSGGAALTGRPGTLTAFWTHAVVDYAMHVIGWKSRFITYTHSLHKDIRKRALRKLEREAKKV